MRDKAQGADQRLQFDSDGQVVGRLVKAPFGAWILLLKPDFILVTKDRINCFGLWDSKRHKLVEFAKNDQRNEV